MTTTPTADGFINSTGSWFEGNNHHVKGDRNHINGHFAVVDGNANVIRGKNAKVTGANNHIIGPEAFVRGNKNLIVGPNAVVRGDDNKVFGANSSVVGFRNDVKIGGQPSSSTTIGLPPPEAPPRRTIAFSGADLAAFDESIYRVFNMVRESHPLPPTKRKAEEEGDNDGAKKKKLDAELDKQDDLATETDTCTICLEHRRSVTTECGHLFCKRCIRQILKNQKECPTCRVKIVKEELRIVYL
jgi:hypothetical protein